MTRVKVEKLAPALGAEVSGVDLRSRCPAMVLFAEIRAAWLEHLVLRFRGQKLSDPQLLAFSSRSASSTRRARIRTASRSSPSIPR